MNRHNSGKPPSNTNDKVTVASLKPTSKVLTGEISRLRNQVNKECKLKIKYNKHLCNINNVTGTVIKSSTSTCFIR